jgi:F-type H+-transporting ATPase subunit beta
MTFYVYENWTHKRARVHAADCGYCNSGRGTQASHSGRNDRWLGPYATSAAALLAAQNLRQPNTQACANCLPSEGG